MNYYGLQLHKYILGEVRTDGWKSEWRIDLERRMAEGALKPRPVVKQAQIKVRQERVKRERQPRGPQKPRKKRVERPSKWGIPAGLSPAEYRRAARKQWRETGRCGTCGQPALKGRYSCAACQERKASYYCRRAKKQHVPRAIAQRFCRECKALLNANNVYGFCSAHYKQKRQVVRMLKVAA